MGIAAASYVSLTCQAGRLKHWRAQHRRRQQLPCPKVRWRLISTAQPLYCCRVQVEEAVNRHTDQSSLLGVWSNNRAPSMESSRAMSVTVTISASASALGFCTDQDPRQRAGGEVSRSESGNGQAVRTSNNGGDARARGMVQEVIGDD